MLLNRPGTDIYHIHNYIYSIMYDFVQVSFVWSIHIFLIFVWYWQDILFIVSVELEYFFFHRTAMHNLTLTA